MQRIDSKLHNKDNKSTVFNAFSRQRFFEQKDILYAKSRPSSSVDKLSVIDEILSANITELTHRSHRN